MANYSRSSGRSSRSAARPTGRAAAARGGRAAPPARGGGGGGGGGGAGLIAGVIVILAIGGVAIFALTRKESKPRNELPATPAIVQPSTPAPARPSGPVKVPPPAPSAAIQAEIQNTGPMLEEIAKRAQALYDESVVAHKANDVALWQSKLAEARDETNHALDIYNDVIVANMPSNKDYDMEEAAQYWLEQGARWIDKPAHAIRIVQKIRANMKGAQR